MKYSRRSRNDDVLFIALLVIPAFCAASFYLQSESQVDRLASASKLHAPVAQNAPTQTVAIDVRSARAGATD